MCNLLVLSPCPIFSITVRKKETIISGVTINKYSTNLCAVQNIDIYFNSCIKIHV